MFARFTTMIIRKNIIDSLFRFVICFISAFAMHPSDVIVFTYYTLYIYIQCTSQILGKILQFILMKSINLNAKFCWKLVGTCYKFGFLLKVENSSEQADAEQIDIIVNLRKTQFFHKYHVRNIKLYTEKFRKMALNRCAYANFKNIHNKSHHIFTFLI